MLLNLFCFKQNKSLKIQNIYQIEMSSKRTKQTTVVTPAVPSVVPEVAVTAPSEPKKRVSKKMKEAPVVEVPVVPEPVEEESETEPVLETQEEKKKKVVSKESVNSDFTALTKKLSDEIEKLSSSEKTKGVKFLKSLNKSLKVLHNETLRVLKFKKSSSKKNITSGFLKPIGISSEMASFTEWDPKQLYSRVSVTQFICEYIKKNKLFNVADKRQILCDSKLKNLLKYDASNSEPLTYFRLQQYLKPHFVKSQ